MSNRDYQICTRCVMDTSDPEIFFDENGVCNHCHYFDRGVKLNWFPNDIGSQKLTAIVKEIKRQQKSDYPCIMGLSGGADSSYLAYIMVKKYNIKPLIVHVDAGWNSELAVKNIEIIVKKLDLDLYTYVVNWEEKRDLQLAFLKSAVVNQDIPQDHAFFAKLSEESVKHKVKYILSGSNIATESILPLSWGHDATDVRQLKAIHKKFGKLEHLRTYPISGHFRRAIWLRYIRGIKTIRPLNYLNYNKQEAVKILREELDWRDYGVKHSESTFTKFFQSYYLPYKFGYDKRRAHLSSLILSSQCSRQDALKVLESPAYHKKEVQEQKAYVARKLGISQQEFEKILALPNKSHKDYPNNAWKYCIGLKIKKMLKLYKLF